MKQITIVALLFFALPCFANDNKMLDKDEAINQLTQTMGLQEILHATIKQTEASVTNLLSDIGSQAMAKLPDMTEEQKSTFYKILDNYTTAVLGSIDIETATKIYIRVIADKMSIEEIQHTLEYYRSKEGKKAKKTIEKASNELNTYLLTQIEQSTKIAYKKLIEDINTFARNFHKDKSK